MMDSEQVVLELLARVRNKDVDATNELVRAIEPLIERNVLPPDIYLGIRGELESRYTKVRAIERTIEMPLRHVSYSAIMCAISALLENLKEGIRGLQSEYSDHDIISTNVSVTHVVDSWNEQKLGVRCVMEFVVIKKKDK